MEWFETRKQFLDGVITSMPVGSLCLIHGLCAESYPELTPEELFDTLRNDGKLNRAFEFVENRVKAKFAAGTKWPELTPATVSLRNSTGCRLITTFAVLTAGEFSDHFKIPHYDVAGVKLASLMQEEGGIFSGLLLQQWLLPKNLQSRRLELYSDVSTVMTEDVLSKELVIRAQQGKEQFKATLKDGLSKREAYLRLDGQHRIPTYKDLLQAVAQAQEDKKAKEAALLEAAAGGLVAEESEDLDEEEGGGRRRVSHLIGKGAEETGSKKKPVKKKSSGKGEPKQSASSRWKKGALTQKASAAKSSASSVRGETPHKGNSGGIGRSSVVAFALDSAGPGSRKQELESTVRDDSLTIRTVYPSLDIESILLGSKLDRSTRGVAASASLRKFDVLISHHGFDPCSRGRGLCRRSLFSVLGSIPP